MSAPLRKVPLKAAHGLSVSEVLKLRKTQAYWQRVLDMPACRDSARANAQARIDQIEAILRG